MGTPYTEYAKVIRWYAPRTTDVYGLRTIITLPTQASIGESSGFINFYLAGTGSEVSYECGLSSNQSDVKDNKWHWFWNTGTYAAGGTYDIPGGATVPIELSINSSKTLDFKVNGSVVKTFVGGGKPFKTLTNPRLIVAACDQEFKYGVPSPLPNWDTLHYQVVCSNVQYRTGSRTWVTFPGTPEATEFWPLPSDSQPHTGTPLDYIRSVSTGKIIASLKRF